MSLPRFYIAPTNWNPDHLVLAGDEAHHCLDVLRCSPGDKIVVFNGEGTETTAEIADVEEKKIFLKPISTTLTEPLAVKIILAQAIPKGKNMDLIVQKATELGAHRIVPLLSERTVVKLDNDERDRKQQKWQRAALEACKQSGQNLLPAVDKPVTVERFFQSLPASTGGETLPLIASLQPDSRHFKKILAEHQEHHGCKPSTVIILVGPEGDFTPAEFALAHGAACQPLSLGPIVLRTETAAFYTLAILGYELF